MEKLPAAEQEELLHFLSTRVLHRVEKSAQRPYSVRTHPGGPLPGIDPTKLAQLADDF